jgi:hypothetical protein
LGYYISKESMKVFRKVVSDLLKSGQIINFLISLIEITEMEGFSFKKLPTEYVKQMMLIAKNKNNLSVFENILTNDSDTEYSEDESKETYSVSNLPMEIDAISLIKKSYLSYDDFEEDDTDEDDEELEDTESGEEQFTDEEDFDEDETVSETVANTDTDTISEDTSDEPEEESDGNDIFDEQQEDDLDDSSEKSYCVQYPVKKTNKKNFDDDDFVVKRHK